ncbi:MAG: proton-conducting transporter membrane subunit [Truepera sp.]|nr:proton-conducting transporter membrane subunit [Truepera sp.]
MASEGVADIFAAAGLEIMSLAVYVLSAWRHSRQSEEAGMKYFLLGAFASAIFIYGIALLYGATGAFHYLGIASSLTGPGGELLPGALLRGLALVGVGEGATGLLWARYQ